MNNAGIIGMGSYLPERRLTNFDLEKMVDTSDEWIVSRTGIRERCIAAPEEATSDLSIKAAQEALKNAGITADQLDLIIVATLSSDMLFPSTACLVQDGIKATKAAAFDLQAGCSGFIYATAVASQFIQTGIYKYCLVIGAEIISRILDYEDRNTCVIFGDGAGAAVLGPVEEGYGILALDLGADGSGGHHIMMPAGGSRIPASEKSVADKLHYVRMNGNDVFKFAVRVVPDLSELLLEKAGLSKADVDLVVPHQANFRIVEAAMKRLEQPIEKAYMNIDRVGNMSAASIPVALDEVVKKGKVRKGDILLSVGFGTGLTWGGLVMKWAY